MKPKLRAVTLLAVSPLALMAVPAHAQQSTDTTSAAPNTERPGDIVVTGTRGALESAERFKRESSVLVDGISADDIGALPDESIADSLVRVPGLSANDNENGFAEVSVRGLGPDLANTTYNGRVLPSTRFNNRRLDLGDLPSEGIARAFVQKTAAASTIEGGLGGTIGLESVHPLETARSGLSLVGRVETDDVSQKIKGVYGFKPFGYRGEVSYIHRFSDRLGVSFSYAHIQQTNARPSTQLVNYSSRTAAVPGDAKGDGDVDGDGYPEILPDNAGINMGAINHRRDSALAMVQWRPIDSLTASLDGYYINTVDDGHGINFIGTGLSTVPNEPTTYTVKNSVVTQYQGYTEFYRETVNDGGTKSRQLEGGLNLKYDNGGPFSVALDVSYAQAKVDGQNRSATIVSDATDAKQTVNGQIRPFGFDSRDPKNIILDFGAQSPDDYALQAININNPYLTDTSEAARLDFHYNRQFAFFGSMDFGMRADRRIKDDKGEGNSYGFGKPATRPDLDATYLFADANPLADAGQWLGGPKAVTFPLFDLSKLLSLENDPNAVYNDQPVNDITGKSKITEDTMALYYQGNIDVGNLTGNIGVRYFVTDETIQGFATKLVGGVLGPVTPLRIKHSYHYFLPSLNLRYAITPQLIARGALSETMSRAEFSALRIGGNIDYTALLPGDTFRRGNPDLKPYTSKNADLDLEWYPSKSMTLGIQGFYKQVTNFIINQSIDTDLVLPDGTSIPVTLNTQVNDPTKRNFYGVEIIARRDFDFLPGFLRYFGTRVDYSRNWTDAFDTYNSADKNDVRLTPNNFNPWVLNAQLYFSKRNIDAHLAYRLYGRYSRDNCNCYQSRPGGAFDLTGSVALFRGIRLIGTIRNLTKAHIYQTQIDYRYPRNYGMARNVIYPGRSFVLGVRAHF